MNNITYFVVFTAVQAALLGRAVLYVLFCKLYYMLAKYTTNEYIVTINFF